MRICFVGHKFHTKTRSSGFFTEILALLGTVDSFFSSPDESEADDDELIATLAQSAYDCYVFWQTEYIAERLLPLGLGRFIIVPMYDGAYGRSASFWRQFVGAQFISFSRVHHEELQRTGCKTAYFQYFPAPAAKEAHDFTGPCSAFFWERRPGHEPTLQTVVKICSELGIGSLNLHIAPDFSHRGGTRITRPETFVMEGVSVTTSRWFEDPSELHRLVERAQFFFAPRALEGIGLSFLEAMARGQIVVAPDSPTASEYIRHRTSGVLYDCVNLKLDWKPDAAAMSEMSWNAASRVATGHKQWAIDNERLGSLIVNDGRRWSTTDSSSHFRNEIRRRASRRAREQ